MENTITLSVHHSTPFTHAAVSPTAKWRTLSHSQCIIPLLISPTQLLALLHNGDTASALVLARSQLAPLADKEPSLQPLLKVRTCIIITKAIRMTGLYLRACPHS